MNIKRKIKYYIIRLLRLKTDAKDIAFGLTLGFFPNWFPTFGTGPIISVALAKLFKTNILSALIGGISGALLWPILFVINYKTGNYILDFSSSITDINEAEIEAVSLFYYKTKEIGFVFLSGAIINSIIFSFIIYFTSYVVFKKYRYLTLKLLVRKRKN